MNQRQSWRFSRMVQLWVKVINVGLLFQDVTRTRSNVSWPLVIQRIAFDTERLLHVCYRFIFMRTSRFPVRLFQMDCLQILLWKLLLTLPSTDIDLMIAHDKDILHQSTRSCKLLRQYTGSTHSYFENCSKRIVLLTKAIVTARSTKTAKTPMIIHRSTKMAMIHALG